MKQNNKNAKVLPEKTPNIDKNEQAEIVNLNKVLESIEPEKRQIIARAICAMEEHKSFRGPLPAPEDFNAYKVVLPDAPERILRMAEKQLEHRINTETKIVDAGLKESKYGQVIGAVIVLVCLAGSVFLGMNGHDWLAGSMVAIIATVGTIFVLRKEPDKDNLSEAQKDERKEN
ncbi:MAG: DUF2335 domain-containing protein [Prevotella bivia]|uniref:DUF2335 domain-containing protein n=2 Tax=Prevotella bivia TaxID=28125 RepID=UPI00254A4B26|nr:DUF2335 domain-containing protein [Prevotella bivia]MDU7314310.1 DUF2335 domain-containing protein [Prevotella bivia]MDZ3818101.1 DUF2335 domain-containing protein [Prevotella bivia]